MSDASELRVIGAGLAGCEAAWQAAQAGAQVALYEMRPVRRGPAHHTDRFAELVCSNSLRGAALENAVGLLKEELARGDSLIVNAARACAVPAGGALAVDREQFSEYVERALAAHPRIRVVREEVTSIDPSIPTIIACGPLPSEALLAAIDRCISVYHGPTRLHYYDAAAPIVTRESLDLELMYEKSRYDKGDGADYLNVPLDREQYTRFIAALREAPRHTPKEFELDQSHGRGTYFEGCLPVEVLAERGDDALRFGPMKPVGLRDPRTGVTPHAVVQLRKETADGGALNLVGFQTQLTWPAQRAVFGLLPGFEHAEWLRLGVMHRNTFVDAPRLLDEHLRLRPYEHLWLAGQITGAEGYVEAAACGWIAGRAAAAMLRGEQPRRLPLETAMGAVVAHLQNTVTADFQPANVTWSYFLPLAGPTIRDKRARRAALAQRALAAFDAFLAAGPRLSYPLHSEAEFEYTEHIEVPRLATTA